MEVNAAGAGLPHGRRHLDLREPQLPLHLRIGGDDTLEVTAKDSDGRVFSATSAGKAT
jgi:hypothetical protein